MKRNLVCHGRGCVDNIKFIISEIGCYETERRDCPRVPVVRTAPLPKFCQRYFQVTSRTYAKNQCTDWMVKMGIKKNQERLLTMYREGALYAQKQGLLTRRRVLRQNHQDKGRNLFVDIDVQFSGPTIDIDVNVGSDGSFSIDFSFSGPSFGVDIDIDFGGMSVDSGEGQGAGGADFRDVNFGY